MISFLLFIISFYFLVIDFGRNPELAEIDRQLEEIIKKQYTKELNKYRLKEKSLKEVNLLDDLSVCNFFNKNNFDLVIHCALKGRENTSDYDPIIISDNLLM